MSDLPKQDVDLEFSRVAQNLVDGWGPTLAMLGARATILVSNLDDGSLVRIFCSRKRMERDEDSDDIRSSLRHEIEKVLKAALRWVQGSDLDHWKRRAP